MKFKNTIIISSVFLVLSISAWYLYKPIIDLLKDKPKVVEKVHVWENIKKRNKLIAVTHNNLTGYFIYNGRTMGIHYDMLNKFCKNHNLDLQIVVENDIEKCIQLLKNHSVDVIAVDLTKATFRDSLLEFTTPHGKNHQVLVQRKKVKKGGVEYISDFEQLRGKRIYVQKGSVFGHELMRVGKQKKLKFTIVEDSEHTMEELITMVSKGKIDYTACDERVALANQTYLDNIDLKFRLSGEQDLCWGVPLGADSLKYHLDGWITNFKSTKEYGKLQRKYFTSKRNIYFKDRAKISILSGNISPYDDLIKKYATKYGVDWRLVAAIMYKESKFIPDLESWAGAVGLMQLMPGAGANMGAQNLYDPEQNIMAGVKLLKALQIKFDTVTTDVDERTKFVIAAYNAGAGHVIDAYKLADKHKADFRTWTNSVDSFIILKSNPRYFSDPVVQNGYCRGCQISDFVNEVWDRYIEYRNHFPE